MIVFLLIDFGYAIWELFIMNWEAISAAVEIIGAFFGFRLSLQLFKWGNRHCAIASQNFLNTIPDNCLR
jgi:hypothetical protein